MEETSEDSDPGGTPVFRAKSLEQLFSFKRIFLKFEGVNPSGTHKDRAAYRHVKYAVERGFDTVTVGTCGNYGVSLSYYAKLFGLKAQVYVPERYHTPKISAIKQNGAFLNEVPGAYEEAVELSRDYAMENGWYDANPGNSTTEISYEAYANIAYEIYQQFGRAPDAVAVPVGNGTTLVGIYSGFKNLRTAGLIDKIPRILGASTAGGNPVVKAFKENTKLMDLNPNSLRESSLNEPLIAYHAYDGEIALEAIRKTNGYAEYVSDSKMLFYKKLLKKELGLNVLPASTAPLEAIRKVVKYPEENLYVAVITGRS
ncbi:MAG: pyridoxal-phosphate dependent enzyme [Thermoplasmatales archaeon]|jgi:Threonine synthase